MKNLTTLALATSSFLLLTGYNACDPVIENNGFDLWCGDELCTWELEKGAIERVPTWHTGDYGVDFVGDAVAISQLRDIDSNDIDCLRFDLVARAEETATMTLELDFYDDGVIDVVKQIPTSDFAKVSYLVRMPAVYQGIRFRVAKTGTGRAVLAQIYAESASGCTDPAPVLGARPLGAWCDGALDCTSSVCATVSQGLGSGQVCSACDSASDCGAGQTCGVLSTQTFVGFHRACVPEADKILGLRCEVAAECASGICEQGLCASCESSLDCGAGQCTAREPTEETGLWLAPRQCDPGAGGASSGDECLIDADCSSARCAGNGDLRVCELDGRTCEDGTDCPEELRCLTVGTAGGTCQ